MHAAHRTATLGDIVVVDPAAATLFERLGLDYCCGGADTLEQACDARGLDPANVRTMLDDLRADSALSDAPRGLAAASISEICQHILVRRHGPLRVGLQRISTLLTKVVRAHGEEHRELATLQERFAATRGELETHLRLEEDTLFPACCALDKDDAAGFDAPLLDALRGEHDDTGEALRELRRLGGGYDVDASLCATHRLLLQSLNAFEAGMHQHVHEENNLLFPKVRRRLVLTASLCETE